MRATKQYLSLFITITIILGSMVHASAEVVIVGNNSISDSSVASSDLENVFLGKKRKLSSGSKVKPVTLKSGAIHDEFLSAYVKKSASQFSAYWKRKIVDGTGIPPKSFQSEAELIEYIKKTPNAIGYVSVAADGVKVLSTN